MSHCSIYSTTISLFIFPQLLFFRGRGAEKKYIETKKTKKKCRGETAAASLTPSWRNAEHGLDF